jgi:hypothetical protein
MPTPPFQSVLERFPDHVKAIGMVSVEVANLDIHLGYLFAEILRIPGNVGEEIFLTPKSAFGRLDLLNTAVEQMMEDKSVWKKHLKNIHKRAASIINHRHSMIHDSWGINVHGSVVRRSIRGDSEKIPVPLKE